MKLLFQWDKIIRGKAIFRMKNPGKASFYSHAQYLF